MTLLDQAKAKQGHSVYHCNYCNKNLSNVVRIRCAKCDDFDLCLECFSVGAEVNPHKNDHPYYVKVLLKNTLPLISIFMFVIYSNFPKKNSEGEIGFSTDRGRLDCWRGVVALGRLELFFFKRINF